MRSSNRTIAPNAELEFPDRIVEEIIGRNQILHVAWSARCRKLNPELVRCLEGTSQRRDQTVELAKIASRPLLPAKTRDRDTSSGRLAFKNLRLVVCTHANA